MTVAATAQQQRFIESVGRLVVFQRYTGCGVRVLSMVRIWLRPCSNLGVLTVVLSVGHIDSGVTAMKLESSQLKFAIEGHTGFTL